MSGGIPQYAFMTWCLVKAQGHLYLHLLPYHVCFFHIAKRNTNLGDRICWLSKMSESDRNNSNREEPTD
jgi:hypothetical protein